MTIDDCYGSTVTAQLETSLELLGHTDLEQIEFGAMMSVLGIDPWLGSSCPTFSQPSSRSDC